MPTYNSGANAWRLGEDSDSVEIKSHLKTHTAPDPTPNNTLSNNYYNILVDTED